MTRVLFVDDEPYILSGLKRMLHSQREWEMVFATSGNEALELAERVPLDAIVSDMRMPGMDGVALLTEMRRRHPAVARLILSGQTVQADAMRCLSVAHQSIAKPCQPADLVWAVERACNLQGRLQSLELRAALGRVDSLPSPPLVVLELKRVIERDDATLDDVDRVISTDPGMAAKVLQVVNSAFFGLARQVSQVHEALAYLGLNLVHDIVVTTEIFRAAEDLSGLPSSLLECLRAHANSASSFAADLARGSKHRHQAVIAGLLHDIGWLVLASQMPERLKAVRAAAGEGRSLEEVELEVLGASHAELGAYLLSLWGLPPSVVEAVLHHHDADSMPHDELDLPHLVRLADFLAAEHGTSLEVLEGKIDPPDEAYVARLGVAALLEQARGGGEPSADARDGAPAADAGALHMTGHEGADGAAGAGTTVTDLPTPAEALAPTPTEAAPLGAF
ncbi:MAG TPA: response regulator [Acidimicrobiales bacterium]|nr:response regulator [Acidimicrobiales bacterium]